MDNMQVNNDTTSSIIQRSLKAANKEAINSIEKLSYGKKMKAMEDAAGSIIADQLETQVTGSQVATNNIQDGASLLQTAESDMGSISDNLQRMRELTVQAANGTNGKEQLDAIKSEMSSLASEINRVSKTSSFNDKNLLDGTNKDMTLQIGANSDSNNNSLHVGSVLNSASTSSLGVPTGSDLDTALSSSDNAASMIDSIDKAIGTINDRRSSIGAYQNTLDSTAKNLQVTNENLAAAESRIRDVDVAKESASLIQSQIKQNASTSLLAQANQNSSSVLALFAIK